MNRLTAAAVGALLACAIGCSDDEQITRVDATPDATGGPVFVVGPTVTLPNDAAPLSGLLTLTTSEPTTMTVSFDDGVTPTWQLDFDDALSQRSQPILGLRADRSYAVTVTAANLAGASSTVSLSLTTAALPDDFPAVEALVSDPASMEPGYTLLNSTGGNGAGYLFAVDAAGDVVWLYGTAPSPHDATRLPGGNIVFTQTGWARGAEIDMMGNVVRRYHASNYADVPDSTAVAIDSLHHDLLPLANGNLMTLSSELRTFDDYPTSELDPTPNGTTVNVIGDVVVEFETDGSVVQTWSILDLLDPYRVGYGSFRNFWDTLYGQPTLDWSHGNAVVVDPNDDGLIVSLNALDAVVKFRRDGELVWILGPHENWTAPWSSYLLTQTGAPFTWNYHQHAPAVTPSGTLLLFDNGAFGASPPDMPLAEGEAFSRVLELDIDPVSLEVSLVWEYDAGQALFSRILGDADHLPTTGNVLVDFGAVWAGNQVKPRIIEVTRTVPPVVVFDLQLANRSPTVFHQVYRSARIPSLYP